MKSLVAILGVVIVFGLFIGIPLWLQGRSDDRFNAWTAECLHDKGVVSQTEIHLSYDQYECIRNGQIIDHVN